MRQSTLSLRGLNRELEAFLVEPERGSGRGPAIVVIHEIFGLDDHIRDVATRIGREGYTVLAPNLFSGPIAKLLTPANVALAMAALRDAPPDLRAHPERFRAFAASQPAERRPVLEAFAQVTSPDQQDRFAEELKLCREHLGRLDLVDPSRIGAVGFCFGGAMVGRWATIDPGLAAGVIFYGQAPPFERIPAIRARLLGLYGGEDPGITNGVPAFAQALRAAGKSFDYHVYPGARHAFFNDARPNYHPDSARDAWRRVLEFLAAALKDAPPPSVA